MAYYCRGTNTAIMKKMKCNPPSPNYSKDLKHFSDMQIIILVSCH